MAKMVCPRCDGKGTQALHGIAITGDEWDQWHPDEQDDYLSGRYDTPCSLCNGERVMDKEEVERLYELEHEMRMGY